MSPKMTIFLICCGVALAGNALGRVWTNNRGTTINAVLMAAHEDNVELKLSDGRIVTVPRNIFSGADQEYIANWVRNGCPPEKDDLPPDDQKMIRPNWNDPWPTILPVADYFLVREVQETPEWSVYETEHFRIESSNSLTPQEKQKLASLFESSLALLARVPLNIGIAIHPSRKYLIRTCFSEEELEKEPGLRYENIKFSPTSFCVLLTRSVNKNKATTVTDPRFAVSHWCLQAMDAEHWLVDSFSRYLAFLPRTEQGISLEHVADRLKRQLPAEIRRGKVPISSLKTLLSRSVKHLKDDLHSQKTQDKNAWSDLLWIIYWCHLAGDGKAEQFRHYLQACDQGDFIRAHDALLGGKTAEEIEKDMVNAWKKFGMQLKIAPALPHEGNS